jgi:hypothetical protein
MTTVSSKISLQDLRAEFDFIKNSFFDEVAGVFCVDSGKPGPTLGITINTHGNEPSGLAVLAYFRHQFSLKEKMPGGKVFFVLNNLKATEQYFAALQIEDGKERTEAKGNCRFSKDGFNFNRLPKDALTKKGVLLYEVMRAQELSQIWKGFDFALDIHSTSQPSVPMIVACGGLHQELIVGFPVEVVISNIENIQIGKPAIYFYGKSENVPMIGIEAGFHEDEASFACAVTCALSLMQNVGILPKADLAPAERIYQEHKIDSSVMFPDKSYELVKAFEMFEPVQSGQVLASGDGKEIIAPFSGLAMFYPGKLRPDSIAEEVLFLSRPAKKISI